MTALIIVDMQNDFMPEGALAVPEADACVPVINRLIEQVPLVVATQDWHSKEHVSFATNHPGKKPGDIVIVEHTAQILWPPHCIRNTKGAELVTGLNKSKIESLFYKGTDKYVDSYSAFFDNARRKSTGLADYLRSRNIRKVIIVGVATEYCVLYSAIDALDLGFKVVVVKDACRGIELAPGDIERAFDLMKEKGALIETSDHF